MDPLTARMYRILDFCEARLEVDSVPVVSASLAPGAEIIWDHCCGEDGKDGQLRIALSQSERQWPQMSPAYGGQPCVNEMAVAFAIGVLRCSQTFQSEMGEPPDEATLTAEMDRQNVDRRAVITALTSDFPAEGTVDEDLPIEINGWEPVGPQGGCVGGILRATLFHDECF